jgi:hypothetical protein
MANMNLNYTCSYAGHFIATGSSVNLTLPFEPDSLKLYNYTQWGTNDESLMALWFKDFPAGDGLILTRGTTDLSSTLETTNGFTDASTDSAVADSHLTISGITQASPAVVTTSAAHGLSTGDRVIITKVLGMVELNTPSRNPYVVTVLSSTTFSLQDIYGNDIDSSSFTAYTSGGQVNVTGEARSNLMVAPTYVLTLGTAVDFNDSDVIYFEAFKYGDYQNLGDAANF